MGMGWYVAIMLFSAIQWWLIKVIVRLTYLTNFAQIHKEHLEEEKAIGGELKVLHMPTLMKKILDRSVELFFNWGLLIICYVVLFFVAVFDNLVISSMKLLID